jgi:hypothetical protein
VVETIQWFGTYYPKKPTKRENRMSGPYDQWSRLTPAEKTYFALNPTHLVIVKLAAETATKETVKRFGHNGRNDDSDAFRHCFWSALLARDLGGFNAKWYTDAHEAIPNNTDIAMDTHNNGVGIWIGTHMGWLPDSDRQLADRCEKALKDGKLKTSP